MQRISLLALPSSLATSLSLPLEILNAANEQARIKNRSLNRLQIEVVGEQPGAIQTSSGLQIMATTAINDVQQTDLLILPSLWRNPVSALKKHRELLPWLQHLARQQSNICAVGTSSFFLAEAGLLNQQAATTHWYYCDLFAKRYPHVLLKRQYLITQAHNLYCAASVNSIADLTVHLVKRFYGQGIARAVEAQFSPEIRRPFEEHAYTDFDSSPHHDEDIIAAQEWLNTHHTSTVSLSQLAEDLQLSQRNFNRRFKEATGITAGEYLQNQRLHTARELLRTSNLSISEVAIQAGYQDSSYFCARFKAAMGQTPLNYRKTARGKFFHLSEE